jgi:hypothetical protein
MLARAGHALAALALVALPQAGLADAGQSGRSRAIVPDFAFMVGRWTDDGNCANAARLDRDGRFHTGDGRGGLWAVDDGRLILTGGSTLTMRIVPIDRNSITVYNSDGTTGRSIRCPSAGAVGPAPVPVRVSRDYVVGRWTDDGNCADAADFRADGRFFTANGTGGSWSLAGKRMTMTGTSTLTLQIVPIDRNVMNVINEDGSVGRSTRC